MQKENTSAAQGAVSVPARKRALSWRTFEKRYQPIDVGGNILRDWNDSAVMSADDRLVWTVVDCDGKLYVVPGFANINYMGRILCIRPYSDVEVTNPGYCY
jgi:hypothetical protein